MAVRRSGAGINTVRERLQELSRFRVAVGWLDGTKYDTGVSVAMVAARNEFGDPSANIPPRPMLQETRDREFENWSSLINNLTDQIMGGSMKSMQASEIFGAVVIGDIKKTIAELNSPPLKQSTVDARVRKRAGSSVGNLTKPLVDEGILVNSITYEAGS